MSKNRGSCLIRGDGGRTIRGLLDRIGDRWSLLVVATHDGERLRFGELQHRVPGISQRMLTRTLRNLERDGLVRRTSYREVPPRVEYELTDSTLMPTGTPSRPMSAPRWSTGGTARWAW